MKAVGPGLITGASDDDPSGIGTYATVGAALGYALLWTAPVAFPLMIAVQFVCAKVGLVAGRGVAGVLRRYYPRWVLVPAVTALCVANTLNAGADIGAIAAGINLLLPISPGILIAPVSLLILVLQIWGSYRMIARVFKWLTLSLLAYIGSAWFSHPVLADVVWATIVPTFHLDRTFLLAIVAILGTTISPYLFFWQASEEVEEETALGRHEVWQRRGATDRELQTAAWDTGFGMLLAIVVMYAIMLATAATLHQSGQTEIHSAVEAAAALRPLAGDAATTLLALGLIGTGLLAVPVLTAAAAYAVAEAFDWPAGLDEPVAHGRRFYSVIAVSTVVGMAINYFGINAITALFWAAVVNGLLAPPLLALIMLIANNPKVMGRRVNGRGLNFLGWTTVVLMSAAVVCLLLV